ncbi:LLM class flavin-dependent oxidoreductase [Roseovarius phycicola]|uniref:LLM class flavin-dependent oxidoreductase n=1 Tax=Roseovarius phycicola TaxID=3080976 RepID=A0ABZ2HDJ1_9RHOB
MKFHLAINLERMTPETDMKAVRDHTLEMVKMADAAGFEIAWAAEHHALEMTIAPNPFQILGWWGEHAKNIRLGVGVVNAAYWHPINLAGEAAMLDLLSDGRLEFGIGSGAYQREFDRMKPGLDQKDSWRYMQEMLPVVQKLWEGDYAHDGEFWQFPSATSCPKPVQSEVPVWVAARAPITFDYAVEHECNILSWPLTMPMSEVETYAKRLKDAVETAGKPFKGTWAIMRHTAVYESEQDRAGAMGAIRHVLGQFGNLMMKRGEVLNGFPEQVPLEELDGNARVDPDMLEENLMFGSPAQVVEKLKAHQAFGADAFVYYASMGADMDLQKRSLQLFIDKVMPEFAQQELAHAG